MTSESLYELRFATETWLQLWFHLPVLFLHDKLSIETVKRQWLNHRLRGKSVVQVLLDYSRVGIFASAEDWILMRALSEPFQEFFFWLSNYKLTSFRIRLCSQRFCRMLPSNSCFGVVLLWLEVELMISEELLKLWFLKLYQYLVMLLEPFLLLGFGAKEK